MCNSFSDNGYKVKLLLPKSRLKKSKDFIKEKFGYDIDFEILFYEKTFKNEKLEKYFGYNKIYKFLNQDSSQYVFTRIPNIAKYIIKLNKKLIFEAHNNRLHERYNLIDYFLKKSILSLSKEKNFTLFICISENLKRFWKNYGIDNQKLLSLHDGFDIKKYIDPKSKIEYRDILNIEINKTVAVYTGSLYADRKIESILYLAKKNQDVHFIVVGGPEENRKNFIKKARIENIENINFVGRKNHKDIHKYLFSADILLALWSKDVPTINYCSPLKLFEYMASGTPIIANNYVTIREVLEDEKDAFLINGDKDKDLNEVFKKVKNKGSIKIGKNARKKALDLFTWDKRVNQICKQL